MAHFFICDRVDRSRVIALDENCLQHTAYYDTLQSERDAIADDDDDDESAETDAAIAQKLSVIASLPRHLIDTTQRCAARDTQRVVAEEEKISQGAVSHRLRRAQSIAQKLSGLTLLTDSDAQKIAIDTACVCDYDKRLLTIFFKCRSQSETARTLKRNQCSIRARLHIILRDMKRSELMRTLKFLLTHAHDLQSVRKKFSQCCAMSASARRRASHESHRDEIRSAR
jgi:hypothetical protein